MKGGVGELKLMKGPTVRNESNKRERFGTCHYKVVITLLVHDTQGERSITGLEAGYQRVELSDRGVCL